MSGIGTGYDLSNITYSPDGRTFQTEYAQKAVDNSGTAVGIRCKDGVVLGVEKLVTSKMMVPNSNRRIFTVDKHAGIATAGLVPDGRSVTNRAQSEAQAYKTFYGEPIPAQTLCDRLASYMHLFTLYWHIRPYGTAALLAAYDLEGPQLFLIDPSGTAHKYYGTAVGKGRQAAKTAIERLKLSELTCREAVVEVAKIIHKAHDEAKDKAFELELTWVCDESNKQHVRVPEDVAAAAQAAAKAALEAEEMAD